MLKVFGLSVFNQLNFYKTSEKYTNIKIYEKGEH